MVKEKFLIECPQCKQYSYESDWEKTSQLLKENEHFIDMHPFRSSIVMSIDNFYCPKCKSQIKGIDLLFYNETGEKRG